MERTKSLAILALALCLPGARIARADPLPDPAPLALPDPKPSETRNFPPALATAGTADPGHELNAIHAPAPGHSGCDALDPCGAPPPSLDHVKSAGQPG